MAMLLEGLVGSHAYGLAHAASDKDFLGVEVYPTERFLGMFPEKPASRVWKDENEDDHQVHEVGKYLGLLAAGNPTASELMWLDEYHLVTPDGERLLEVSRYLLSQRVRGSFLGFTLSNGKHAQNYPTPERRFKAARHFMRLYLAGQSLWLTGSWNVRLTDDQKVVANQFAHDAEQDPSLFKVYDEKLKTFFESTPTPLREMPDMEKAEAFLLDLRRRNLG